jgi:hypothetical protein
MSIKEGLLIAQDRVERARANGHKSTHTAGGKMRTRGGSASSSSTTSQIRRGSLLLRLLSRPIHTTVCKYCVHVVHSRGVGVSLHGRLFVLLFSPTDIVTMLFVLSRLVSSRGDR